MILNKQLKLQKKMVTEWGMSDLLGPMTFGKKSEEVFLGRDMGSSRDYSETTARMIDEEVSRIVRDAQRLADEILRKEIDILHHLAKELLKYETIDTKDLKIILEGKKLTRPLNGKKIFRSKRKVNYNSRSNNLKNKQVRDKKETQVKIDRKAEKNLEYFL